MDACLAEAGFPEWDWSWTRTYAEPVDPLYSTTWFEEPEVRFKSAEIMAQRPWLRVEEKLSSEDFIPADMEAAASRCFEATPRTSDEEAEDAAVPPVARKLADEWSMTMFDAGRKHGGTRWSSSLV